MGASMTKQQEQKTVEALRECYSGGEWIARRSTDVNARIVGRSIRSSARTALRKLKVPLEVPASL